MSGMGEIGVLPGTPCTGKAHEGKGCMAPPASRHTCPPWHDLDLPHTDRHTRIDRASLVILEACHLMSLSKQSYRIDGKSPASRQNPATIDDFTKWVCLYGLGLAAHYGHFCGLVGQCDYFA